MDIAARLDQLRAQIAISAQSAGREAASVQLVAVSKTFGPEAVRAAYAAGQRHFGENRVQEWQEKAAALADLPDIHWHLIGPLQTNKAKYVTGKVFRLHTIDSLKLLGELQRQAERAQATLEGLIQINISEEAQKSGTDRVGAEALLRALVDHPRVRVHGLMGMAALVDDPPVVQRQFAALRQMAEALRQTCGLPLGELSMGMSGDFALAIAEGATWVRVGSALFGAR